METKFSWSVFLERLLPSNGGAARLTSRALVDWAFAASVDIRRLLLLTVLDGSLRVNVPSGAAVIGNPESALREGRLALLLLLFSEGKGTAGFA